MYVCTDDSQSSGSSYESIVTPNVFSKLISFLLSYLGRQPCATAGIPCPAYCFQLS